MERFQKLLPQIAAMKPLGGEEGLDFWEVYDNTDTLIGYAFAAVVPEVVPDLPDMDEMDKYQIYGILAPKDHKILCISISFHPEGPENPWAEEITAPEFTDQYIGLTVEEVDLEPYGKIDALTDATLSSTWITDTIRDKMKKILKRVSQTA